MLNVNWQQLLIVILIAIGTSAFFYSTFRESRQWQKALVKISRANLVKLSVCVFLLIYVSFVLYKWWHEDKSGISAPWIYGVTVTIFIAASLVFGILNYSLHVLHKEAFTYSSDIIRVIIQNKKTEARSEAEINKLNKEMSIMDDVIVQLRSGTDISTYRDNAAKRILKKISISAVSRISISLGQTVTMTRIGASDKYLIKSVQVGPHNPTTCQHYLLADNRIIYFDNVSVWTHLDFTDRAHIIDALTDRVGYLSEVVYPYWINYKDNPPLSVVVFVQAVLMELLGLKQNYIVPISLAARCIYIVFGMYKFLFLGTFVSILIKR